MEAAASSPAMDSVAERSDRLMVADAVSLARLSRLGDAAAEAGADADAEAEADADDGCGSRRRRADAMLPARPNWLADSQSLPPPSDAEPDADSADTLASPVAQKKEKNNVIFHRSPAKTLEDPITLGKTG